MTRRIVPPKRGRQAMLQRRPTTKLRAVERDRCALSVRIVRSSGNEIRLSTVGPVYVSRCIL